MTSSRTEKSFPFEPVFIGSFRSGTTLLVNLLGLHPELLPWFETKAFCEALRWLRVLRQKDRMDLERTLLRPQYVPGFGLDAVATRMLCDFKETAARIEGAIPSGKAPSERYPIGYDFALYPLEDAEESVHEWVNSIGSKPNYGIVAQATGEMIRRLGAHHLDAGRKNRWINKTPEITRFAPELRSCLGPCRCIMMIRDGHDVVRSAEKLRWAKASEIAEWWKAMIVESRAGGELDPDRYLEVRFEELVESPATELDRVLAFLGVDCCGAQLVDEYLALLGIENLREACLVVGAPGFGIDQLKEMDGVVDEAFNRSLGY